jgi:signal transduction histidine kinase
VLEAFWYEFRPSDKCAKSHCEESPAAWHRSPCGLRRPVEDLVHSILSQVVSMIHSSQSFVLKRAPKIVLLLDEQSRVLNVNRSLAGTSFASISEIERQRLHRQLHPDCDETCHFQELWTRAWASLDDRDSIEWELNDTELKRLLRLNLSKPPTAVAVERERREQHALLIITDITRYRREHESLIEREQMLARLLQEQGATLDASAGIVLDDGGDANNGLMEEYHKQDRSFRRQLILAQENERKRIASDLHDGIAQTISVVKYNIEASVARLAAENPAQDVSMFDGAIERLRAAVDEVRRVSSNLAPSMLEDFGLAVALEWLCKEFNSNCPQTLANCTLCIDECDTPDLVKISIYRLVQEALNNVSKHASATGVDISLTATLDGVGLTVADNGIGIDERKLKIEPAGRAYLGLRGMRERVEATGGAFDIESSPGEGVVIHAEWAGVEP